MPSRFEQDTARTYCCERELLRPKTDVKTAVKGILILETSVIIVSLSLYLFLNRLSISFRTVYSITGAILPLFFLKKILVTAVELYQHYAPEDVRRRCVCMPTCSEYAILALRKYGVIKGLYKIYGRLTKKCKGSIYSIDYP